MAQKNKKYVVTPFQFFIDSSIKQFPIRISIILIAQTGYAISILFLPIAIKKIVDVISSMPSNAIDIWSYIYDPFMYFVWVNLSILFFSRITGVTIATYIPQYRVKPRLALFGHLCNHSVDFFSNNFSGSLGSKINEAATGASSGHWKLLFDIWTLIIVFCFTIYSMFDIDYFLGCVVFLWVFVYVLSICWIAKSKAKMSEKMSRARSKIAGLITDIASNITAIKSFSNTEYEKITLEKNMQEEVKAARTYQIYREIGQIIHFFLTTILLIVTMIIIINLYEQKMVTLGMVTFVFTLLIVISEKTISLILSIQEFINNISQLSDGVKTIMQPHFVTDKDGAKNISVIEGSITLDNMSFAYPELMDNPVFKKFNLDIPSGQKLGLVGPSGAGKSTLINLLLRFYDIDEGAISIDGQNIADCTQDSLRKQISIIPQDTSLFHRSLAENIGYGDLNASEEQVIAAAKKAHAHNFISALPQGYETLVGERGVKLSGGQRQRIAIARAILKDAPILILDEATSALDSESEQMIQESLKKLMKGKTVIAIAHRLSTIAHLDRIIVIDEGKIVEDNVHDQLLKNKKGLYQKLWSMQSGGFIG